MRFDLLQMDSWDRVCDQYRSRLSFAHDGTQTIQVYRGFSQALLEVALGIAKIFTHKRTVAIAGNAEPAFEVISQVFSSDGFEVVTLTDDELKSPASWFELHKDQLLFVLHGEDDPVTGRCFETEPLAAFFNDKRIFRIHVSHASFRQQPLAPSLAFEARVISLAPSRALLIGGSRCKLRPVFTPQMPWVIVPEDQIERDLQTWSVDEKAELKSRALEFEAHPPMPYLSYFKPNETNRVYDRVVLTSAEFDGLAVITELGARLNAPSSESGEALATLSPCLWQSERLVEWRRKIGESDQQIRGMIALANDFRLAEGGRHLADVINHLRLIQEG